MIPQLGVIKQKGYLPSWANLIYEIKHSFNHKQNEEKDELLHITLFGLFLWDGVLLHRPGWPPSLAPPDSQGLGPLVC